MRQPPQRPARFALQAWLTLLALAIVWGSSYILIKKSLVDFTPVQVGHLRLAIAGLSFTPVAVRAFRQLSLSRYGWLLLVGLCGTGFPSFLFPFAQTEISSSLAAALSSLTPLMTLVVGALLFGARIRGNQGFGILVGLAGAIGLVGARYGWTSFGSGGWPLFYIGAAVLATVCYATSSNVVKAKFPDEAPMLVTAGAMFPLGVYGLVGVLVLGDLPTGFSESPTLLGSYASIVFLGLIGTALASYLFFRLVQLTEPVFASTVSYLVPIVAFGWGIADGEPITWLTVGLLALILLGVNLARR